MSARPTTSTHTVPYVNPTPRPAHTADRLLSRKGLAAASDMLEKYDLSSEDNFYLLDDNLSIEWELGLGDQGA